MYFKDFNVSGVLVCLVSQLLPRLLIMACFDVSMRRLSDCLGSASSHEHLHKQSEPEPGADARACMRACMRSVPV